MESSLSLRQRLLDAERDFLAVREISALRAFEQQWSTLCEDFQHALDDGIVEDDVKTLAHGILTRIEILGEDLAALENISMSATDALMTEIDTLFTQMTIEDLHQPPKKRPQKMRVPTPARRKGMVPASSPSLTYLPPAWNWLLHNLHDPYPTESTKKLLSAQAKVDIRTLESWFKSVRSRIGWVAIYKKRFQGSRRMAQTVARAVFLEDYGSLDIPVQIASEFRVMKSRAENLFPAEQTLGSMDSPSPATSRSTTPDSSHSQLSRPPSLVFSSTDSDSDDDRLRESSSPAPTEPVAGAKSRKRSYSDIEDANAMAPQTSIHHSSTNDSSCVTLSSPAIFDVEFTSSRKRRMSDTGLESSRKRCRYSTRPQAVSAPLPQCTVTGCLSPPTATSHPISSVTVNSQPSLQDQPNLVFDPRQFDGADLSQYVNIDIFNDTYCDAMSACGQGMVEMWESDDRSLSEIVRDAPSSTTLKLLPLPPLDAFDDNACSISFEHWDGGAPSLPAAVDATTGRDLPPIHWSSSSLAGALGPLARKHERPSEPSTAPGESPAEAYSPEANVSSEIQDLELQTSTPSSFDAILPGFNSGDPLEETASLRPEDVESIQGVDLQQLLDLLGSPQYTGFAF